jgi:hypothetical protein
MSHCQVLGNETDSSSYFIPGLPPYKSKKKKARVSEQDEANSFRPFGRDRKHFLVELVRHCRALRLR